MQCTLCLMAALALVPVGAPVDDLFQAIEKNDAAAAEKIVKEHPAAVNAFKEYFTPLHAAATDGRLAIVSVLLDARADLEILDKNVGQAALHWAASRGHKDVAALLIARGAKVDAKSQPDGFTPVHRAAQMGYRDIVALLLTKGAAVEGGYDGKTFNPGFPPLHWAVRERHLGVVRHLLAKGADANSRAVRGWATPLQIAAENNDLPMVKLLLARGARVEAPHAFGAALSKRNRPMVDLFVNKGIDCTDPDHLIRACIASDVSLVELLLAKRAPVNGRNKTGMSPLHAACQAGDAEIVALLLAKGADVQARDDSGITPLHQVASGLYREADRRRIAEMLLAKGADVNRKSKSGVSPLYVAVHSGQRELAEFLVANGAVHTVLTLAALGPAEELARRLEAEPLPAAVAEYHHGPLHLAALFGRTDTMEVLLKKGADINGVGVFGQTPLHHAARLGHERALKFLLDHGAEVNARMSKNLYVNAGATPLKLALDAGHDVTARLLLAKGAEPKLDEAARIQWLHHAIQHRHLKLMLWLWNEGKPLADKALGGFTPLHLAAQVGDLATVRTLLDRGADAAARAQNLTPLHLAVKEGHTPVVALLLTREVSWKDGSLLETAIHGGDVTMVKLLLDKGADARQDHGLFGSPLRSASFGGTAKIVQLLLERGADASRLAGGALHMAALHGHKAIVELLVKAGTEVDSPLDDGFLLYQWKFQQQPEIRAFFQCVRPGRTEKAMLGGTPLHAAVAGQNVAVAEFLLSKGADPKTALPSGATLLHLAAALGDVDLLKLLLAKGLDINAADGQGLSPLRQATLADQDEAAAFLKEKGGRE